MLSETVNTIFKVMNMSHKSSSTDFIATTKASHEDTKTRRNDLVSLEWLDVQRQT